MGGGASKNNSQSSPEEDEDVEYDYDNGEGYEDQEGGYDDEGGYYDDEGGYDDEDGGYDEEEGEEEEYGQEEEQEEEYDDNRGSLSRFANTEAEEFDEDDEDGFAESENASTHRSNVSSSGNRGLGAAAALGGGGAALGGGLAARGGLKAQGGGGGFGGGLTAGRGLSSAQSAMPSSGNASRESRFSVSGGPQQTISATAMRELSLPDEPPRGGLHAAEVSIGTDIMAMHPRSFVGRRSAIDALKAHLGRVEGPNPLVIVGPPGCGKTAAVATFCSEVAKKAATTTGPGGAPASAAQEDVYTVWHSFGDGTFSNDLRRVLCRLCLNLKAHFNLQSEIPSDRKQIAKAFPMILAEATQYSKVIIVLDGMELCDSAGFGLEWLPESLPVYAKVVMTSGPGRWIKGLLENTSKTTLEVFQMPVLTQDEMRSLLNKAIGSRPGLTGVLSSQDFGQSLKKEDSSSPAYIHLVVEEIGQLLKVYKEPAKVKAVAAELPGTLLGLVNHFLEWLERSAGVQLMATAMGMLALCRTGLTEEEMMSLLHSTDGLEDLPLPTWQGIFGQVAYLLWSPRAAPGSVLDKTMRIRSSHVREAVLNRYLPGKGDRRQLHVKLASFFLDGRTSGPRVAIEGLHHLLKAEEWEALRVHAIDPNVICFMYSDELKWDLRAIWEALAKTGGENSWKALAGGVQDRLEVGCRQGAAARDPIWAAETTAEFLSWAGKHMEADMILRRQVDSLSVSAAQESVERLTPLLKKLGKECYHAGRNSEARDCYNRSLALIVQAYGQTHPAVADVLTCIGEATRASGDLDEALAVLAKAASMFEQSESMVAKGHEVDFALQMVKALKELADLCEELNKCPEAEGANEQALERLEGALGGDHPEFADQLLAMSESYKAHGEWEKGEAVLRMGLQYYEMYYGKDALVVSRCYNSLAELSRAQGHLDKAEELYQRALEIAEHVRGHHHVEVATYLNNMAELCRVQGRLAEAEPLYLRALSIDESFEGGADSSTIAIRANNLAELYRDQGRLDEAAPLYKRAIVIDQEALGKNHPNVATYLNNLAGLYKAQGQWSEAEEHYQRAMAIDEKVLGRDHPDIAIYLNNLAGLYKAQGRLEEAEPLYKEALEINREALGDDHTDVAIFYNNIGLLCKAQGNLEDAEPYYQKAIEIGERSLGPDHPQVAKRLSNLGALLFEQGKIDGAEELFARALGICNGVLGTEHPDTKACQGWVDAIGGMREEAEYLKGKAERDQERERRRADREERREKRRVELEAARAEELRLAQMEEGERAEAMAKAAEEAAARAAAEAEAEAKREEEAAAKEEEEARAKVAAEAKAKAEADAKAAEETAAAHAAAEAEAAKARTAEEQAAYEAEKAAAEEARAAAAASEPAGAAGQAAEAAEAAGGAALRMEQAASRAPEQQRASPVPALDMGRVEGDGDGPMVGIASARMAAAAGAHTGAVATSEVEVDLDAFMAVHVDYLGNRKYRCQLDSKVLSTFNLMRVHVAKKFAVEIKEWGERQRAAGPEARPAPPRPAPAAAAAGGSASTPPPAVAGAVGVPSPEPGSEQAEAQRKVQELEAELGRLQQMIAQPTAAGSTAAAPLTARSAAQARVRDLEMQLYNAQRGIYAPPPPPPPHQQQPSFGTPGGMMGGALGAPTPGGELGGDGSIPAPPPVSARTAALQRVQQLEEQLRLAQATGQAPQYPFTPLSGFGYPGGPPATAYPPNMFPSPMHPPSGAMYGAGGGYAPLSQTPAQRRMMGVGGAPAEDTTVEREIPPRDTRDFAEMLEAERGPSPFQGLTGGGLMPKGGGGGGGGGAGEGAENSGNGAANGGGAQQQGGGQGMRKYMSPQLAHTAALWDISEDGNFNSTGTAAGRAHDTVEDLLVSGQVDVVGLFMSARSEQVGKRRFVCELDGRVFSTVHLMRVHFEKSYAQEAETWWRMQAF